MIIHITYDISHIYKYRYIQQKSNKNKMVLRGNKKTNLDKLLRILDEEKIITSFMLF